MKRTLLFIWQLPQHLLGMVLRVVFARRITTTIHMRDASTGLDSRIYAIDGLRGGISLGEFIMVPRGSGEKYLRHEIGHSYQSRWLGPLYLVLIGIPSILWSTLCGPLRRRFGWSYFAFPTERWADHLGRVRRTPEELNDQFVQIYNPRMKRYVKINKTRGVTVDVKSDPGPFEGIRIIRRTERDVHNGKTKRS